MGVTTKPAARPRARKPARVYAFASRTAGLWRCPLVRGLVEREQVEALARAAGCEVVWVEHRTAGSKPVRVYQGG